MFRLTVFDQDMQFIDTIDHVAASRLIYIGQRLQRDFGAFYHLEWVEGVDMPTLH